MKHQRGDKTSELEKEPRAEKKKAAKLKKQGQEEGKNLILRPASRTGKCQGILVVGKPRVLRFLVTRHPIEF